VVDVIKTFSLRIAVLVVIIAPLVAFCPSVASAATVTVTVGNNCLCFSPSSVMIHPGDTVQWTWSSTGHSTTSGSPGMPNGIWDSGILNQGATFSHTFNTVGSFPYYCTPHGACCNMVGTVTVSNPSPTPSPTATPSPTSTPSATPGAAVAAVADFNGDGHPDWVVRNAGTRQTAIWYLNNNVFIGGAFGPTLAAGWGLRGVADFNSDSHPDYSLFNLTTRQTAI